MRNRRELYVDALRILLRGKMSAVIKARDWELLAEVAHLAYQDAPADLAVTDPALFRSWRAAVTRYHLRGWTNMTPELLVFRLVPGGFGQSVDEGPCL